MNYRMALAMESSLSLPAVEKVSQPCLAGSAAPNTMMQICRKIARCVSTIEKPEDKVQAIAAFQKVLDALMDEYDPNLMISRFSAVNDRAPNPSPSPPPTRDSTTPEVTNSAPADGRDGKRTTSRKRPQVPDEEDTSNVSNSLVEASSTQDVPRKKRKSSRGSTRSDGMPAPASGDKLNAVTMGISPDCPAASVETIRQKFLEDITHMKVSILQDNKRVMADFSDKEATEITNFFFDELMSEKSLKHLIDLVSEYSKPKADGGDVGAAIRARTLARDSAAPAQVRKLFSVFSKTQRTTQANSTLGHFLQMHESWSLLKHYNKLREQIDAKDPKLLAYLRGQGKSTTHGRRWATIMLDHLAESVKLERNAFVNICQKAQGLDELTKHFGMGILGLLPRNTMSKLRGFGSQRMERVYELLQRSVPAVKPVCEYIDQLVVAPILSGQKDLQDLVRRLENSSANATFQGILEEARGSLPLDRQGQITDVPDDDETDV